MKNVLYILHVTQRTYYRDDVSNKQTVVTTNQYDHECHRILTSCWETATLLLYIAIEMSRDSEQKDEKS